MKYSVKDKIKNNILSQKINFVQLDPNGLCNSKCWYCPVRYKGNPKEFIRNMPIEEIEHILKNIHNSSICTNDSINFANFNEIFLYPDFEKLIALLNYFNYKTVIYSNGTTLTPEITDFISNNTNIIYKILFNIPTLDKEDWINKTGMSEILYYKLLNNLKILHEKLANKIPIEIKMHNAIEEKIHKSIKKDYPNMITTNQLKVKNDYDYIKRIFPRFNVSRRGLIDRSGILSEFSAYKNIEIGKLSDNSIINGCNQKCGSVSKIYSLLCVNSLGDTFVCCNDFNMKYTFGNLLTQSVKDCWYSEQHIEKIDEMFSNYCNNCVFREFINIHK